MRHVASFGDNTKGGSSLKVFLKSDIGLVRSTNQDACQGGVFSDGAAWVVVCDGMGGANGGDVASSVAVEEISSRLKKDYKSNLRAEGIKKWLTGIVQSANDKLYKMQKNKTELSGMGTTVELVLVKSGRVHIVHAGDSRVYGVSGADIKQLTVDHSMVQEMVQNGEITSEQAMSHPNKNIITRALGTVPEIQLDYIEYELKDYNYILVCTDGLSNYVMPDDLVKILGQYRGEECTQMLVDTAKSLGGNDNITVALIASSTELGVD